MMLENAASNDFEQSLSKTLEQTSFSLNVAQFWSMTWHIRLYVGFPMPSIELGKCLIPGTVVWELGLALPKTVQAKLVRIADKLHNVWDPGSAFGESSGRSDC